MTASPPSFSRSFSAAYRLQFNSEFGFSDGEGMVDYLSDLGVSLCYASPIFAAKKGTRHGYDVTDQSRLNPELGSPASFRSLTDRLRKKGMGLLLDLVPNHMCITDPSNRWWEDVLENGPSSPYARFFDIDWNPFKAVLSNKVLLPFLGDQYGRVLENKEIQLVYHAGSFFATYHQLRVPVAPRTTRAILIECLRRLKKKKASSRRRKELETILTELRHLPLRTETNPVKIERRFRSIETLKRRLARLTRSDKFVRESLDDAIRFFNGEKGNPASFDPLERLLAEQAYRLAYWRVAADEINYRRFFDINELAAIRVEEKEVFQAVHRLVLRLIREGRVQGLRIDHVDGLYDPKGYLVDLQEACRKAARPRGKENVPIVVEKIMEESEPLRSGWPVQGTTGYDFLNAVNGLFVDPASARTFQKITHRFVGDSTPFKERLCVCKEMITHVSNAGECTVLAWKLERISEQHRWSRDFTFEGLRYALRQIIACYPVYRSYTRPGPERVHPFDAESIRFSVDEAIKRNPATNPSIFNFIGDILLKKVPPGLAPHHIQERDDFIMRFQQLTGPVMAKGMEDTAFYQYYPLASLTEVGGHPDRFGVSTESFHRFNKNRRKRWPLTMNATTTHDTKRSEDVRARLNTLSEIPLFWYRAIRRWSNWNKDNKTVVEDHRAPTASEEYLIYQTVVGTWPFEKPGARYTKRIQDYMIKAMREAKVHTSWVHPNEEHEKAVSRFIKRLLTPRHSNRFLKDFQSSLKPVAHAGLLNSLCQTVLKIASPGMPDFYQGTEDWSFTLVDPDNRRPVDFQSLKKKLSSLLRLPSRPTRRAIHQMMRSPRDGRIKMWVTMRLLYLRRSHPEVFVKGDYRPIPVKGSKRRHVVAFSRTIPGKTVVVIASRFFLQLSERDNRMFRSGKLSGASLKLDKTLLQKSYTDVLTGRAWKPKKNKRVVKASDFLADLPAAVLEST